jgi:hypothetical protein
MHNPLGRIALVAAFALQVGCSMFRYSSGVDREELPDQTPPMIICLPSDDNLFTRVLKYNKMDPIVPSPRIEKKTELDTSLLRRQEL